jgi:hypothetical protein
LIARGGKSGGHVTSTKLFSIGPKLFLDTTGRIRMIAPSKTGWVATGI